MSKRKEMYMSPEERAELEVQEQLSELEKKVKHAHSRVEKIAIQAAKQICQAESDAKEAAKCLEEAKEQALAKKNQRIQEIKDAVAKAREWATNGISRGALYKGIMVNIINVLPENQLSIEWFDQHDGSHHTKTVHDRDLSYMADKAKYKEGRERRAQWKIDRPGKLYTFNNVLELVDEENNTQKISTDSDEIEVNVVSVTKEWTTIEWMSLNGVLHKGRVEKVRIPDTYAETTAVHYGTVFLLHKPSHSYAGWFIQCKEKRTPMKISEETFNDEQGDMYAKFKHVTFKNQSGYVCRSSLCIPTDEEKAEAELL